jgi:two-component system sensor histidine kinase/response regulator
VSKISRPQIELDWINNFDDAATAITGELHDAYLIDYRLGVHDGLELLKPIDLQRRATPFIVLTGAGDEEIEQRALRQGVADYLVKGRFDAELLSRVLRYSLHRKQLESQRIKHLLDVNASKDEFIALASHELRTPASAVKQYLGMMLDGYLGDIPEDIMTTVKTAYDNNERQLKIINDLLLVAQLDLQKISMHKTRIDLAKLLDDIIQGLPALRKRRSTVSYSKPKTPVLVNADPNYLRMAISNICENAAKYTPAGKAIRISLSVREGRRTCIEVADEGIGIAKSDQDKLFKKFSRIHSDMSVKVGGNGLGLYWAQQIVHMHGGSIKLASAPDEGSTFTISVPLAK